MYKPVKHPFISLGHPDKTKCKYACERKSSNDPPLLDYKTQTCDNFNCPLFDIDEGQNCVICNREREAFLDTKDTNSTDLVSENCK